MEDPKKAGYKTSEFWLTLVAVVVGYLGTSGVWEEGTIGAKTITIVATVLAALGYTASRTLVKSSAIKNGGDS